jgi:hypothetical protein
VALADILAEKPGTVAMAQVIAMLAPDILVLSGVDYDLHAAKLTAFRDQISLQGLDFGHFFAPVPNAGMATGTDMNANGRADDLDDAHGYGTYSGERGLGLLSRFPLRPDAIRDFSAFLWRDLPGALLYDGATAEHLNQHRLSSVSHIEVPVILPDGTTLHILAYHAGPPLFGDHVDRNLHRNHDETAFWRHFLDNRLPFAPPQGAFVLVGGSNLDPADSQGLGTAMRDLLAHPALQDPRPTSPGGMAAANPSHRGPPELDTVAWDASQGNLRVSYVLPSADLQVETAGVLWPLPNDPLAAILGATGTAHKPVWVDIALN